MMTRVDAIVAIDAPAKNKRAGRPARDPTDWTDTYLDYYRRKGNAHNACKAANVSFHTMLKHRRASPAFASAARLAYREYGAMLAQTLGELGVDKGNVIALLASLKAHSRRMAARYSEKAVDNRVLNLQVNVTAAPPDAESTWREIQAAIRRDALSLPAEDAQLVALPAPAVVDAQLDLNHGETRFA